MHRTIIVGDVHGCIDELKDLFWKIGPSAGDRIVFVGDVVARGRGSVDVIHLARDMHATLVRGNHEEKLLRYYQGGEREPLSGTHKKVATELSERDWAFLARTPLWFDVPENGVRVVHAGVLPGLAIEEQAKTTLLSVRSIDVRGQPQEKAGPITWASRYRGPPHIVFGHHAQHEPQIHRWATGLDTGCVYGGALTAMVLREGEHPPPMADRLDALVSVPAHRAWFGGRS
jgi:hypothetical protein